MTIIQDKVSEVWGENKSMSEKSIKKHLRQYFQAYEEILSAQFNLSTGASAEHIGALGENREKILIDFLNKHIPQRFSVEQRGVLFDKGFNQSQQVDIIIYEKNYPRLGGQSPTLYFIEGFAGGIEVKSTLTKKSLEDAIDNIASIKKLEVSKTNIIIGNTSRPDLLFGGVYAYKSQLDEDQILEIMNKKFKEYGNDLNLMIDFIYTNDGIFMTDSIEMYQEGISVTSQFIFHESKYSKLYYFLIHLSRYVSAKNLVPIDLNDYFGRNYEND